MQTFRYCFALVVAYRWRRLTLVWGLSADAAELSPAFFRMYECDWKKRVYSNWSYKMVIYGPHQSDEHKGLVHAV